ncbi:prenyltransferase/squalene oxidase repeat-containing protein [Schlesneria sp. DSM 10557]|uniref:prenyltransferase/squalene oxidase repeat-containing protein n=1 Tax=Schlesneria sp. DSM 10557 TaxID=3044399 RepID=UPI0035A1CCA9
MSIPDSERWIASVACGMAVVGSLLFLFPPWAIATAGDGGGPTETAIKAAIRKSLPLLEKGARGSLEQRKQCFNCHNQGLPLMAMTEAQARGFQTDAELQAEILRFTADFLARNKKRYRDGEGQGGQVDTAGYALWTLNKGNWPADETTAAVVEYLLIHQVQLDHYEPEASRPPSEQSYFTSTYVAVRGLKTFGTDEQQELIDARIEQIQSWLQKAEPQDHEDRVFRLRLLHLLQGRAPSVDLAVDELKRSQNEDGSWSQVTGMNGDAYATSTALVALHDAGGLATSDPVYQQGLAYLISQQHDDGSWHVVSRAKALQSYFESGYPHGKDQFLSSATASWATIALALALPETTATSE